LKNGRRRQGGLGAAAPPALPRLGHCEGFFKPPFYEGQQFSAPPLSALAIISSFFLQIG
jgi:hypothetical protein